MSNSTTTTQIPTAEMLLLARDLVGPLLLGALLNVWLYGAFIMQVHTYFQHSPKDPLWMKIMVGGLTIIDTLNTVVSCYVGYDFSVNDFGDVPRILTATKMFALMIITIAVTGSIVQIFFGLRVKWLTGNQWLGWALIIAAFAQSLLGIGCAIGGEILLEFVEFQKFRGLVIAWLVIAAVVDLTIAAILVTFLRNAKTGFEETDDFLETLTKLTIQTGLITAVWATVDLVLFMTLDNNWHFMLNMTLAKLYGNCLMSSLNARMEWHRSQHLSSSRLQRFANTDKESHTYPNFHGTTATAGVHMDDIEMEAQGAYPDSRDSIRNDHKQVVTGGTTFMVPIKHTVTVGINKQDKGRLVWDM